jgi:hypothetical protein
MDPTGKASPLSGSVKADSTPADKLKHGIPLIEWPNYGMTSLEEPTSGAGHRPYSHSQTPVMVRAIYDKSAARFLEPLVNGINLGTAYITESIRASSPGEIVNKVITLTNTYLTIGNLNYDERLKDRFPPGGYIELFLVYAEIALSETILDPLTLTATGSIAWDYKVQEAASS